MVSIKYPQQRQYYGHFALIIAILLLIGCSSNSNNNSRTNIDEIVVPPDQTSFVQICYETSLQYSETANELKMREIRKERGKRIKDLITSDLRFKNWVGTIKTIDATNEGAGLSIHLYNSNVSIGTWNNSISDVFEPTLIPEESDLYNTLLTYEVGNWVLVTGKFIEDDDIDYIYEKSLTEKGGITQPEYLVTFDHIQNYTVKGDLKKDNESSTMTYDLDQMPLADQAKVERLVKIWNHAHKKSNASNLYNLYDKDIVYYKKQQSSSESVASKFDYFEKYPSYSQSIIGDIICNEISGGNYKCSFIKEVSNNNEIKTYPSYLVFKLINWEYKIIEEGDEATDEYYKSKNEISNYENSISGDFNGDGKTEYMWLEAPQIDESGPELWCKGDCICYIQFSDVSIPPIKVDNCIGGFPDNLNDLNNDGKDEIGLKPGWFSSCWRSYYTWSLQNDQWVYLVDPIETHCVQWEQGIKPIEKDNKFSNRVIVNYTSGDLEIKSKTVQLSALINKEDDSEQEEIKYNSEGSLSIQTEETETVEGTKNCLVGFKWAYPRNSNDNVWIFSSDGTFAFSTINLGGMRAWGNWTINSPGNIFVSYTSTTEGIIPRSQNLTMPSCDKLLSGSGSTVYSKD